MRKLSIMIKLVVILAALLIFQPSSIASASEFELLAILNQARNNAGTHSLTMNNQLVSAAARHSNDMATNDFLDHVGSDGSTLAQRMTDAGYNYVAGAENILYRYDTSAQGAFDQWFNSPGHNANMMNSAYCDVGIVRAQGPGGKQYYTMVLGRQPGQDCSAVTGSNVAGAPVAVDGIFQDMRINQSDLAAPATAYCTTEGISLYTIINSEGERVLRLTRSQLGSALNNAIATRTNVLIGQARNVSLYALSSNEFQLVAFEPSGRQYNYIFPSRLCGPLNVIINTGSPIPTTTTTTTTTTVAAGGACRHVVQSGDTLFRLSRRYGTSVSAFVAANNIANPNLIFRGQVLVIPNCQ